MFFFAGNYIFQVWTYVFYLSGTDLKYMLFLDYLKLVWNQFGGFIVLDPQSSNFVDPDPHTINADPHHQTLMSHLFTSTQIFADSLHTCPSYSEFPSRDKVFIYSPSLLFIKNLNEFTCDEKSTYWNLFYPKLNRKMKFKSWYLQ